MVRIPSNRFKAHHPGSIVRCLSLLVCAIALAVPAAAQTTGSLSGTVKDSTDALIPGAQITLVNVSSKAKRTTVGNGQGFFTLNALQTATYNVIVTAKGFETTQITGIEIHPGDSKTIDKLVLKPGEMNYEVTITAEAAGVNLDSPEKSALITAADITRLSTVGRDVSELIKTLPGFALQGGDGAEGQIQNGNQGQGGLTMGFQGSSVGNFSANGSTPQSGAVNVISDGASVIDPGDMSASIGNVNMDMVSEVKVSTSNFGADSAKGPVVINAIGKSGGSSYHGTAYFFARNDTLNANEWLSNYEDIARPPSAYYYPGGNIGGPVKVPGTSFNRNKKLTFFAGFEYYEQTKFDQDYLSFIPSARMLGGDLTPSAIAAALNVQPTDVTAQCPNFYSSGTLTNSGGFCYSPGASGTTYTQQDQQIVSGQVIANGTCNLDHTSPFYNTGGCIPVDPRAAIFAKFWPAPNRQPRAAAGLLSDGFNYAKAVTSTHNGYQVHGRVDENISDSTKLYGTYNFESINDESPIGDGFYYGSDVIPYPTPAYGHAKANSLAFNFTRVFSPTLTNEFVPAATYFYEPQQLQNRNLVQDASTGWTGGRFYNNGSDQLPNIVDYEEGVPDFAMSYFPAGSKYYRKFSYDLADNLTKQLRSHSLKVGAYYEQTGNNQVGYPISQGQYGFNHYNQSCTTNDGLNFSELQNNIANFLQGCGTFSQIANSNTVDMYFHTIDAYVNDEWKTSRKLTLTLGIRFDHLGPWYDPHGVGLAVWNPPTPYVNVTNITQNASTYPGISSHQTNPAIPLSGSPTTAVFYSPRVGLAYDLYGDGRTVFRGGWGAYRFHDPYNASAGPLSTSLGQQTITTSTTNQSFTYAQITQAGYFTPPAQRTQNAFPAFAIYALDPTDKQQPLTYNYNFTVDQTMPGHANLEIGYVGNQSVHTFTTGNLMNQNVIPLGGLFHPDPLTGVISQPGTGQQNIQDYRPYPYYSYVYVPHHIAYSNYNALQVSLNKQKGKLIYGVNYTWSKALGIRGDYRSGAVGDPTVLRNNYGILGFNRDNAVNFTYSYQVGDAYHGAAALRHLLNNWEISGITNVQSGPDTAVLANYASSGYNVGGGIQYTPPGSTFAISIPISNSTLLGTPDISLQPVVTCNPTQGLVHNSPFGRNYINGNCFSLPKFGANGAFNLPDIHGPSFFNSDLTVQRGFNLPGKKQLQLRASGFNFLNHPLPQFYGPVTSGLGLAFGLPAGYNATTPAQAFAAAVQDTLNFGYTPYKGGFRIIELSARLNF